MGPAEDPTASGDLGGVREPRREVAWAPRTRLPHTGLEVGRIGLGSSFGVGPDALEYAFDHGIDYFYWGSIRRPGFGEGIRRLARRHRDAMTVVVQSYARLALLLRPSLETALRRLRLDHADVLLLGAYSQRPPDAILEAAQELRERGRVRYLMMSGHKRRFLPEMAKEGIFDAFMVRYNAAHRGAETEVFPALPGGDERPAICAYTATRWGSLLDQGNVPPGERTPTAADCYRFCLTHRDVDMVLCGPGKLEHVREACAALAAGPLSEDEIAWMRRVGDHVYARARRRAG